MKKTISILLAVCVCGTVGCGKSSETDVKIDYGSSDIYSKEDMDSAIEVIKDEFSTWEGCELHSIAYVSDDNCNSKNLAWMNDLAKADDPDAEMDQCIMFESSFHSPKDGGEAWNEDEEYTGWLWWLARSEGGEWELLTWGNA